LRRRKQGKIELIRPPSKSRHSRSIPHPISDDEVCLGTCSFGQKLRNFGGIMLAVSVQEEKKPIAIRDLA
jgi:hypothetical protein